MKYKKQFQTNGDNLKTVKRLIILTLTFFYLSAYSQENLTLNFVGVKRDEFTKLISFYSFMELRNTSKADETTLSIEYTNNKDGSRIYYLFDMKEDVCIGMQYLYLKSKVTRKEIEIGLTQYRKVSKDIWFNDDSKNEYRIADTDKNYIALFVWRKK